MTVTSPELLYSSMKCYFRAMQNAPPDGLKKLKMQLRTSIILSCLLFLAGWIIYLTAVLFHFDLIKREHVPDDAQQNAYLFLAIIFTVLSAAFAWIATRRNIDLVKRGIWIQGKIEKISSLGKGGTRPVTFIYEVSGTQYRRKKDVPKLFNANYDAQTRVWVIYDPQSPRRCEILMNAI